MNFDEFAKIAESTEKPVILLEGSRNVLAKDADSLSILAAKLTERLPQAMFRSGGAIGSDNLFAQGVFAVNKNQMQLVLPKTRKLTPGESNAVFFDQLPEIEQSDIFNLTASATPEYKGLIDFYKKGKARRTYFKTQFLLRDTLKVTGSKAFGIEQAGIGCFYVNSAKKSGGGTGHTIRVCQMLNVPVIEQSEWMKWL